MERLVSGYEKLTRNGVAVVETKPLMQQIREEASRRIVQREGYKGITQFMEALAEEGLKVWLEFFPQICEELRQVNYEKWKLLNEIGNKGKFTESAGWSPSGLFKFEYEYTPEFYFFMKNYVYSGFFEDDNKKVKRRFMNRLLRGDNPMDLLLQVKKLYGSNHQDNQVVTGGTRGSNA